MNYKKELIESYNDLVTYIVKHNSKADQITKTKFLETIEIAKGQILKSLAVLNFTCDTPVDFEKISFRTVKNIDDTVNDSSKCIDDSSVIGASAFSRSRKLARTPPQSRGTSSIDDDSIKQIQLQFPTQTSNASTPSAKSTDAQHQLRVSDPSTQMTN